MFAAHPLGNVANGGISAAGHEFETQRDDSMSILDKITGRAKKAAGDLTDDPSLRGQGRREEAKGEAKEDLEGAQDRAAQKAKEVADLERKT
jgi:uncharacterized protein YjbJ (UPF0337 family)